MPKRCRERDDRQERRAPDIDDDHHRASAQTVHPHSGEQPDDEPRPVLGGIEECYLDRRRMERQDGDEREREAPDAAAEERDRLPGPEFSELSVPPEPGETRAW